jgi:hypothetical protein
MLASAWPRGVVEVHGDAPEPDPVSGRFDHPAGGERRPCPDGVAERDLLAPKLGQSPGERGHPFGADRSFVRTAEHTGNIGLHRRTGGGPAATSDCRPWKRSPGSSTVVTAGKVWRGRGSV